MNIYEIAEGIEMCSNLLHPEVACRSLTVCFDGYVNVMQNDSADKTSPADVSNGTQQQQQLEQFRYENDKLKIALAQRFHRMTCTLAIHHCLICVGSRPSDHYFRSVCLFVCLFVQSFSQPSSIRFGSN